MAYVKQKSQGKQIEKRPSFSGFTLIELIAVIVILSIVAVMGSTFVARTSEAYQRTQARALLVNTARQALERMTRQLRIALPNSVRLTNENSCVQFMPIAFAGSYFDSVSDASNNAPAQTNIPSSPVPAVVDFGTPVFVTIGAANPNEIYGAGAVSRAGYANWTAGDLVLSGARRWQRNSINRRYYLLDNPQAFCLVGNELRFYAGLNVNAAEATAVTLTGPFDIIARNISSATPFALAGGNQNRQMVINVRLNFTSAGETIAYNQGVAIRNVP